MQERGAFTLVLSGGSLFKALSPLISLPGVDFSKFHVFFVDERNVPYSSPDSNFKGADEVLLSKVLHSISTPLLPYHPKEKILLLSPPTAGDWQHCCCARLSAE